MPRLRAEAEFKYVPGGGCYIEERLGISVTERAHVTKYNDPARRFYVERRLRSLKMKEGEWFQNFFLDRFVPAYEELYDMGRELDEETLVFLLLNALPGSWSRFVEVVVSSGLDMLSMIETLIQIETAEEAELEIDDGQEIGRLGLGGYMGFQCSEARGKTKDRKRDSGCENCVSSHQIVDCRSSALASNLSIQGASAKAAPSRVQKNGSTKTGIRSRNGDLKDEWVFVASFDIRGCEQEERKEVRPS